MTVPEADRQLLALHRPELRYHELEPYRADSAALLTDAFLESAYSNALRRRSTRALIARSRPTGTGAKLALDTLVAKGEEYYPGGERAQPDDYLDAHNGTGQADTARLRMLPGYADRVYCRIAPGAEGRRWLQYWFFYYDNPYRVAWIGQHEGDWEMIQVAVQGSEPQFVTYAQHDTAERRDWDDVLKADAADVPVVYVAKYSHASYFEARTHRRLFGLGNDHTSDRGERVRPEPYFLEPGQDRWLDWPGRWGGTRELIDESPPGPAFQDSWLEPESFHFVKAVEGVRIVPGPLEAAVVLAQPSAPEQLVAAVDQGELMVAYAFPPAPAPGDTPPVRLELALYGAAGPPITVPYDVTALTGVLRHPLPPAGPPYRLEAAVYDENDAERVLEPLDVAAPAAPAAPTATALESAFAAEAAALPSLRRRLPAPHPLRLIARAPENEGDPEGALREQLLRAPPAGGPWVVAPLFATADAELEPELARYLSISSPAAPPPGLDLPALAFEAARTLDLAPGWEVEPDLPSTVFLPDPPDVPDPRPAAEAAMADYDWALLRTRCRDAWELEPAERGAVKGRGIVIGQPDTGYTDHPELEHGALDRLRDFDVLKGLPDAHAVLRGVPPIAFPSHGTSTASVVVSREAGDVTGAAPEAVVVPIRAATTVVHLHNGDLAVAIDYARELKVDVISISMGGIAYPRALRTSIQRAVRDGIIVMAAAGQPLPLVVAPASLPECLAVAGTRRDDRPWALSARGQEVDWSAPAKQVWVAATANEGPLPFKVDEHSGTSFAVALSAGIAALWLAHHGRETIRSTYGDENVQAAFRSLVRQTARRPDGWNEEEHGAGIIDAAALLSADLGSADTSPPPPAPAPDTTEWLLGRLAGIVGRPEPQLRERLGTLAGGELERLEPFAGEIAYRVAENEELREELARAPGATEAAGADPARIRLAALASPSLRAALG